ncbi:MAG: YhgE/Pip domain-containing protein, partial [Atopobium minutum]|nr:YhgE/Pip domain-containing protein [Atopobium minutum]
MQEVVTQSNDSLNDVSDAIDAAYSTANSQSKDLAAALQKAKTVVDARIVPLQTLADELASQEQLLQTIEDSLPDSSLAKTSVQNIRADLMALHARVSNAIQQMQELSDALNKTQSDITTSVTDANTAKQQLKDLVSSSKEQLSSISTKVQGEVHSSLTELSGA